MSENNLINTIKSVVDFIEDNIKENITLDDISNYSYLSPIYLHRIFKAATQKKLMNYVKNRRICRSAQDLLEKDLRIIDIANEYGFNYEQTYIRAFTRTFGLTPDEFRKKRCQLPITGKLDMQTITAIGDEGLLIEPKMVLKPAFYITGIQHLYDEEENIKNSKITRLANEFFYHQAGKITNALNPPVYIGYIDDSEYEKKCSYYTTSIVVTNKSTPPEGMISRLIPTNQYAVFKYIGLHHPEKTTIKDLSCIYMNVSNWVFSSNFVVDMFHFEKIDMSNPSDDYCEVEIYIPVIGTK